MVICKSKFLKKIIASYKYNISIINSSISNVPIQNVLVMLMTIYYYSYSCL